MKFRVLVLGRTLDLEIMRARKGVFRGFGGVWGTSGLVIPIALDRSEA